MSVDGAPPERGGASPDRLAEACRVVREALEARRKGPYWEGRLSTSALATATAVSAFAVASRGEASGQARFEGRIRSGLAWLAAHQNADGGWGDTPASRSNIATTLLGLAAIRLAEDGVGRPQDAPLMTPHPPLSHWERGMGVRVIPEGGCATSSMHAAADRAEAYFRRCGGIPAVVARYGADRTFSAPILTNAVLAGLAQWSEVPALPFELAALPRWTFRLMGLRVVSYALPALIAVGLARHAAGPPGDPVRRLVRRLATGPALRRLAAIIPASGGFLEAAPLTAFVVMSLSAAGPLRGTRSGGRAAHPAVERGLAFLEASQRADGGWPIDSNLSVWNTTLAVNALGGGSEATRDWLLARQVRARHPYTAAAPGGWGWSHLTGSVPDADDTAGALLALTHLPPCEVAARAAEAGLRWLLHLQNRDGGWPTFCRGWQRLPFDRSAPDLTAHALRALAAWRRVEECASSDAHGEEPASEDAYSSQKNAGGGGVTGRLGRRLDRARGRGLAYLERVQRPDGAWLPLWFGNEEAPGEGNPVVGTTRVLAAWRDLGLCHEPAPQRAAAWLCRAQNADGSWGGDAGVAGSIEETALACEALLDFPGVAHPPPGGPGPSPPRGDPSGTGRSEGRGPSGGRGSNPHPSLSLAGRGFPGALASQVRAAEAGLAWLVDRILEDGLDHPRPIGLYFARLWYFEELYPLVFAAQALRRAVALASGKDPRRVAETRVNNHV